MMLGSSTQLKHNNGFLEGEISGISAANIPLWFRKFYKSGRQIAASKEWDIGSMTGIPSCSEILLKEII